MLKCHKRAKRPRQHLSEHATPATRFARLHSYDAAHDNAMRGTQHGTSDVLLLPRNTADEGLISATPATNNASRFLKMTRKYCACCTKPLSTRHPTPWNVSKRQPCHGKRRLRTSETSMNHYLCNLPQGHGHIATSRDRWRTVAYSCGLLRVRETYCPVSLQDSKMMIESLACLKVRMS